MDPTQIIPMTKFEQNNPSSNFDFEQQNRTLFLLQIANSAFPTGTFNHSFGFETFFSDGTINDVETFDSMCRDWLVYSVARSEGIAVAKACELAKHYDEDSLINLDDRISAIKLSKEARRASFMTGTALLNAFLDIFKIKGLDKFVKAIQNETIEGHYCVIFGAICGLKGIPVLDTVLTFLHTSVTSLANVACRLIPLGQIETQKIIAGCWPLIQAETQNAICAEIDDISTATPLIDIASMKHEKLKTRLCMS